MYEVIERDGVLLLKKLDDGDIIGQISDKAHWIKKGERVASDEFKVVYKENDSDTIVDDPSASAWTGHTGKYIKLVRVKCWLCDTYH